MKQETALIVLLISNVICQNDQFSCEPKTCKEDFIWNWEFCKCVKVPLICDKVKKCGKNFGWDPTTCDCVCLNKTNCAQGFSFNMTNCACVKCNHDKICKNGFSFDEITCGCLRKPKPCATVKCPKNYSPDKSDKCICKCNPSSPSCRVGISLGWDQTTCKCVSYCDVIRQCPKGEEYDIWSCSCNPICKNKCPKNFAVDPNRNCDCMCTLPAQICPDKTQTWSRKTCKCHKKCGEKSCLNGNEPDASQNCACKCLKMKQNCGDDMKWDYDQCQCIQIDSSESDYCDE